jgi:hypothetical protein
MPAPPQPHSATAGQLLKKSSLLHYGAGDDPRQQGQSRRTHTSDGIIAATLPIPTKNPNVVDSKDRLPGACEYFWDCFYNLKCFILFKEAYEPGNRIAFPQNRLLYTIVTLGPICAVLNLSQKNLICMNKEQLVS